MGYEEKKGKKGKKWKLLRRKKGGVGEEVEEEGGKGEQVGEGLK